MSVRPPASWSSPEAARSPTALSARTASVEDFTTVNMMGWENLSPALDSLGIPQHLKEKPWSVGLSAFRLILRVQEQICACLAILRTHQHRLEERIITTPAPHRIPPRQERRAEPRRSPNQSTERRCSPGVQCYNRRSGNSGICRSRMRGQKRSLLNLV